MNTIDYVFETDYGWLFVSRVKHNNHLNLKIEKTNGEIIKTTYIDYKLDDALNQFEIDNNLL